MFPCNLLIFKIATFTDVILRKVNIEEILKLEKCDADCA